nr:type II toxin-antitoxin system VapC family toxin [Candidatus Njordarchaeota archaeon]
MGRKIGVDANIFLCVLLPESTKTDEKNVIGSERILKSLSQGIGVTSSIVFAEAAWASLREGKDDIELEAVRHVIESMEGLKILEVDNDIAWNAGKLRRKYYTKELQISYQDAIYLVTCIEERVDSFYTTDSHLLELSAEIPMIKEAKDFS